MLPIHTSIAPRRTPYGNYVLIAINVVIFLLTYWPHRNPFTGSAEVLRPWVQQLELIPAKPHFWQFISYAFLHGSYMHIIGNMFFLYIFGNNVNDKIGHFWYLCFFLVGAVFSGLGHVALNANSPVPTIGASGAVAAVTGAYLVLFPQTIITVLYWFFFIGTIEVPALFFIAFKMILLDNVIARFTPYVAYDAHLAGYTFGITSILVALATGLVSSSNFDLLAMIKRWNRRRHYRDVVSNGYDPFTGRTPRKSVTIREVQKTPEQQREQAIIQELREKISDRIAQRNLAAAAEPYLELMDIDSKQILPRQHLLDIANHFASDNRPDEAAKAYEQFLTHYSNYEYAEQVELMLGLLYSRYLHKSQEAIKHLEKATEKLSDPGQLQMCKEELSRLQS